MKQFWLWLMAVLGCQLASASIYSAKWTVEPAAPIYVGQVCNVALVIECDADESVTLQSLSDFREPESYRTEKTTTQPVRTRTFFYWEQVFDKPETHALPELQVQVMLTKTVVFGWGRNSSSSLRTCQVPATTFEVVELPTAAKALPLGVFKASLTAEPKVLPAAGVTQLTYTVAAVSGRIPAVKEGEPLPFYPTELKTLETGKTYPFTLLSATDKAIVYRSYYVTSQTSGHATVQIAPTPVFDLKSRSARTLSTPACVLTIQPKSEDEEADKEVTIGEERVKGVHLRYAPIEQSPEIAVVPLEGLEVLETQGAWAHVSNQHVDGWLHARLLQEPNK